MGQVCWWYMLKRCCGYYGDQGTNIWCCWSLEIVSVDEVRVILVIDWQDQSKYLCIYKSRSYCYNLWILSVVNSPKNIFFFSRIKTNSVPIQIIRKNNHNWMQELEIQLNPPIKEAIVNPRRTRLFICGDSSSKIQMLHAKEPKGSILAMPKWFKIEIKFKKKKSLWWVIYFGGRSGRSGRRPGARGRGGKEGGRLRGRRRRTSSHPSSAAAAADGFEMAMEFAAELAAAAAVGVLTFHRTPWRRGMKK